ncbi:MAG: tetratricopeptide repeat protein [Terracidiphilus sp.]
MPTDSQEKCLGLIYQGAAQMQSGDLTKAELLFRMAAQEVRPMRPGPAFDYALLVQCHVSLLRQRLGQVEESRKLRESAMKMLDENQARMEQVSFQDLMARVLMQLREYRRAIPFCERAIQIELASNDPTAVAGLLGRTAQCYGLMGLMDHSAIPARAALKILRDYPEDPRLPDVMVTLGNALRKTDPAEAESLYKEAAAFHEVKAHVESATTAWNNLGALCAEQGRHAEALAYYEKALSVREKIPSTALARIGSLLNNIANCHRRMGNYAKAHELLDRAIQLLRLESQAGVSGLASAYGTRGLVLRDEGRDAEAVEFFERSYTERKSTPSPNFELMKENLEDEIAALKRLGRATDAVVAEGRLAQVDAQRKAIPGVDLDLSSHISKADGSVLVEIGYGSRPGNRYSAKDAAKLAVELADAAKSQNAGFCAGTVTIPESTTIMFYGENAEALYRSMRLVLANERICEGATVTIRQGKEVRELAMHAKVM